MKPYKIYKIIKFSIVSYNDIKNTMLFLLLEKENQIHLYTLPRCDHIGSVFVILQTFFDKKYYTLWYFSLLKVKSHHLQDNTLPIPVFHLQIV